MPALWRIFCLDTSKPFTEQQLLQILPNAGHQSGVFAPVLKTAMNCYGIVGTSRVAASIAQIPHESGQLRLVREIWRSTVSHGRGPDQ